MSRETKEVVSCDFGDCEHSIERPGLTATGWMTAEVINREATIDLCPAHVGVVQDFVEDGEQR